MLEKLHSCVFAGGRCTGPTLRDATLHVLEKHKDNTSRGCMVRIIYFVPADNLADNLAGQSRKSRRINNMAAFHSGKVQLFGILAPGKVKGTQQEKITNVHSVQSVGVKR